jgi:hypothetical protein
MWNEMTVRRTLGAFFLLAGASSSQAATQIYYSVGTNAALLYSGNASATNGTLTLASAAADNVGVGDQVRVGALANRYYITGRVSSTVFTLQNSAANGGTPGATNITFASTAITIRRAFNTLVAAEANSSDTSHLNTANLVAGNYQLNWPCYADGTITMAAGAEVIVSGYTTGPANYIRMYTPVSANEVGVPQRHRGVWGTGFQLNGTDADTIQIEDDYVRIEGLTIQATVTTSGAWGGIWSVPGAASDIRISHNIIKDVVTAGNPAYGIALGSGASDVNKVSNNIVFNVTNSGGAAYGIGITIDYGVAYVFNNTIYNCETGIRKWYADSAEVRNNVAIHNTAANPGYVDYYDLAVAPAATRSNNVSSDNTSETVSLRGKTAYATYFRNTTSGSEDLHITSTSLALWGSSGVNLSADANLPVTDDIDGGPRMAPDIGADEFGVCCGLTTTEVAGSTITVTGTGSFEMTYNTGSGGCMVGFYDVAEDPSRTYNMFGAHNEGIQQGGVTWYNACSDVFGSKLDLLEATPTRVRVRQESFYRDEAGTTTLAGVKAVGDHTILPSGKQALRWNRRAWIAVPYTQNDLDLILHWQAAGPLNSWVPFSETDGTFTNPGTDDFLLAKTDVAGARTDFLKIIYRDWTAGNGYPETADVVDWFVQAAQEWANPDWSERDETPISAGSDETWNFLTYFKPTNLVNNADAAVTSRVADYRTPATPTINGGKGSQWQDAGESTGTAGDFYNESEAAYVFDLDPSTGLDFNLDGSATTRYSPFFKIRRWRSAVAPQTISPRHPTSAAGERPSAA